MQIVAVSIVTPLIVLALLAAFGVFLRVLGPRRNAQGIGPAYEAVSALLTPAERSFFGVLRQALGGDYLIFAKVRLADIVQPISNSSRGAKQSAFNRIVSKHVDFVLCDSARISVVAVIELDDRTHERLETKRRDWLVDSALADAGIPVLRVAAQQSYSPEQIRELVGGLFPRQTSVQAER